MADYYYRLPGDIDSDIASFAVDTRRFLAGELAPGIYKARRVARGVYEQRRDGSYMLRVRIAAGLLNAVQAEKIAAIAAVRTPGNVHVTTRQDIQLHDVDIQDAPAMMEELREVGLCGKGGGGNTVRNVTACPYSGVCPAERFDVTSFALAVTEYLISQPGSYNLPRKFKISFSGCAADCALTCISDIGFVAKVNEGGEPGFAVYGGGGMGSWSRRADLIEEWIPSSWVIRYAEAARRLFDKFGDRADKHRARLRHVFARIGAAEFIAALRREVAAINAEVPLCGIQPPDLRTPDYAVPELAPRTTAGDVGVRHVPQRQAGLVSVPLELPLGFITAADLAIIAAASAKFSTTCELRSTRSQNLIVRNVRGQDLAALAASLDKLSFNPVPPSALDAFVACAGSSTCRLGLCLSRGAARACAEVMEEATAANPAALADFKVNISGCPNACGHHPVAAIGLFGSARRLDGRLMPYYRVVAGGDVDAPPIADVPARDLPEFINKLFDDFSANRAACETLECYVARRGLEGWKNIAAEFARPPSHAAAPEYYRDWGCDEDFSLAGRGAGECGAGVFEVIQDDLDMARRALAKIENQVEPGAADLFAALLPTLSALLIVRGVDDRDPAAVLGHFRGHFIDPGWVDHAAGDLLAKAERHLGGDPTALADAKDAITKLLVRVGELFSSLDANLVFNTAKFDGGTAANPAVPPAWFQAKTVENKIDLSGVACPMNFVKAKLRLETLESGAVLAIVLDDGDPIRNVPASFAAEGQEIVETSQLDNGQWLAKVRKRA